MKNRVYETNSGPILEAITSGKTVIVFRFSFLDPDFLDIHVALPSMEEASAIYSVLRNNPDWDWDLETSMINKYLLVPVERNWINSEAPAGLASSICESVLKCSYPTDPEEIQILLNITRNNQVVYDQIKNLVLHVNGNYSQLNNIDVFKLMKMAIASEPSLMRDGLIENGLTITRNKKTTNSSHMKSYGVIDTETANKELAKQLN